MYVARARSAPPSTRALCDANAGVSSATELSRLAEVIRLAEEAIDGVSE